MAEYIENVVNQTSKLDWAFPFQRTGKFPLDRSSLFSSYADAVLYAQADGTDERALGGTSYVGQPISVYDADAGTVTLYIIEADKSLKEVGAAPVGDGLTVEIVDGKIALKGAADAEEGAQPRMKADGSIEWIVPSTDTVDGLQTTVGALQTDLDAVEEDVAGLKELVGTIDVEQQIQDKIDTLDLANTYEPKGAADEVKATIGDVTEGKTVVEMIAEAQEAATYDDTELAGKVAAIEADYLKAADKTELTTAIATAKQEAIEAVLGEAVPEDFDTLKEVAAWIQSDTTSSAELISRVTAIENDYLKGADKTALQGEIDALETFVGALPDGAASTTVVAYIKEVVDALNIGDYAKVADLTELAGRVETVETKLADIEDGAQVNKIETVDDTQFAIDEAKHLTLLDIAMGKVTGLQDALAGKVDKVEGSRLMTTSEAEKLEKLVIGEDGSVEVSGTIAAGNVTGLADWITARAGTLVGLSENNFTGTLLEKLNGIADGAQVNVIDAVSDEFIIAANGKVLSIQAIAQEKITGLPEALAAKVDAVEGMGLSHNDFDDTLLEKLNNIEAGAQINYIKSVSDEFVVSDEGKLSVGAINVNSLVQTDGEYLIMNGGSSAV